MALVPGLLAIALMGCSSTTIDRMYVIKNLGMGCKSIAAGSESLTGEGSGSAQADIVTQVGAGGASGAGSLLATIQTNDDCTGEGTEP